MPFLRVGRLIDARPVEVILTEIILADVIPVKVVLVEIVLIVIVPVVIVLAEVVPIVIVILIHIDIAVDVDVSVITSRPNASSSDINSAVMPIAVVCENGSYRHANSETDGRGGDDLSGGGCGIDDSRVVLRDINDFGLGGFNLDYGVGYVNHLLVDGLLNDVVGDSDDLLWSGFEVAGLLGFVPHGLDGIHDALLVLDEGFAQVGSPAEVVVHLLKNVGEMGDCFDALIPGLRINL